MPNIRKLSKEAPIIVEAYSNGATLRDLATQFNVSSGTVRAVLQRAGVSMRSKGRRKGTSRVVGTTTSGV